VPFEAVLINPKIIKTIGRPKQLWEGCISSGDGQAGLFAKVSRYPKVQVQYQNEKGKLQRDIFSGLPAHVIQHEIDHLQGILFVDRVTSSKTYMTYQEYLRRIKKMTKTTGV
jgi:peptide deformylase